MERPGYDRATLSGIGIGKKATAGETALVMGQELTGLSTVAKLHQRGVKIIAADVSDKRLKAAGELGARYPH